MEHFDKYFSDFHSFQTILLFLKLINKKFSHLNGYLKLFILDNIIKNKNYRPIF
jgi:hypothetical protein